MPIKHATTTAVIGEAQWNENHDLSDFTMDEINEGAINKAFTDVDEEKLATIEAGAQVNVKADWNATSGDAEILNKPTIPSVPVAWGKYF